MNLDLPEISPPPIKSEAMSAGQVRLTADLDEIEREYGALVRDVHPVVARRMAIELLEAAEQAEFRRG
ncbi:hypothetical protein ACFRMQ_11400 [Kitasatospora sp. NPDC056783]|uniref:hypothetical protein n=1 Tax=Kitasatospora sp. NPDC056783 TaxID=3345943 RepID=UPI00368FB9EC